MYTLQIHTLLKWTAVWRKKSICTNSWMFAKQVFNNSPDETAYFRMILNRENVANSVVMIQPSLISYSFYSGPEPALLDVASIALDKILLLDSYFTVVIFHGSTIAQWRKVGYHEQPEHQVILFANFNDWRGFGIRGRKSHEMWKGWLNGQSIVHTSCNQALRSCSLSPLENVWQSKFINIDWQLVLLLHM